MALVPGSNVGRVICPVDRAGDPLIPSGGPPSAIVLLNGVDTAVPVVITAKADGCYIASFTIPATWSPGDLVQLKASMTHDGKLVTCPYDVGCVGADSSDIQDCLDDIKVGLENLKVLSVLDLCAD